MNIEHDPSFKSKEELEYFLEGCDNRIESESDSEDENVDYESWRGVRKLCHCTVDIVKILSRMASNTCAVSRWTSERKMLTNRAVSLRYLGLVRRPTCLQCPGKVTGEDHCLLHRHGHLRPSLLKFGSLDRSDRPC